MRDLPPEGALHRGQDLTHRDPLPGAEVDGEVAAAAQEVVEGPDVGVGEIDDVDVVPHRGSVVGGPVVAEDRERRAVAGGVDGQGDEVGLGGVALAEAAPWTGPGGVEVAEGGEGKAVGAAAVGEDLLAHPLGGAVGALGTAGVGDWDRADEGGAVDRRRRRKEHREAGLGGGLGDGDHAADVGPVVELRPGHRFADGDAAGEVEDPPGAARRDEAGQGAGLQEVAPGEVDRRGEGGAGAAGEVVDDPHLVAALEERQGDVAADVAGAAGQHHRRGAAHGRTLGGPPTRRRRRRKRSSPRAVRRSSLGRMKVEATLGTSK